MSPAGPVSHACTAPSVLTVGQNAAFGALRGVNDHLTVGRKTRAFIGCVIGEDHFLAACQIHGGHAEPARHTGDVSKHRPVGI